MIPAEFDYVAPDSLDAALAALREGGEDAKLLAGGHSLLPLMKLRLAAPTLLVDLRRVPGLSGIQRGERDRPDRRDDAPPRASRPRRSWGSPRRRRRRSPTSRCATAARSAARSRTATRPPTCPAVLLALEGSVVARGEGGEREIAAADLFQDYLTTTLAEGEIVTEVRLPSGAGWGAGYAKFNRRVEDWAMVAVCAAVRKAPDGSCEDVRVGLTNMAGVPLRATATEQALRGGGLDAGAIAAAAEQAAEGTDPPADLNASADYKRHLARVLCRRALEEAAAAA